jgi:hypothetical protein
MLILWIPFAFDVPILDGTYNMRLVCLAELDLDLIPMIRIGILKQEVQSTSLRMNSLFVLEYKLTQTEERRILCETVLYPSLFQLSMVAKEYPFRLDVLHTVSYCFYLRSPNGFGVERLRQQSARTLGLGVRSPRSATPPLVENFARLLL